METFDFEAVVFTAEKNRHKLPCGDFAEFVFDFDSLRLPKNPVIVDFNHDEDQVIGKARVYLDEDGLKAAGTLVSTRPGDVAAEVAERGRVVPFGISPTIDFSRAERLDLKEGEEIDLNGRTYQGPLAIFTGAELRGISVCSYPTDLKTEFIPLSQKGLIHMAADGQVKFANDPVAIEPPKGAAAPVQDGPTVRDAELQRYIDAFGLDRGVAYFQANKTFDEARAETYDALVKENEELKAKIAELEKAAEKKPEETVVVVDDKPAEAAKPAEAVAVEGFSQLVQRLEETLAKFSSSADSLAKLSRRGDELGLTGSVQSVEPQKAENDENKTYSAAFAAAVK